MQPARGSFTDLVTPSLPLLHEVPAAMGNLPKYLRLISRPTKTQLLCRGEAWSLSADNSPLLFHPERTASHTQRQLWLVARSSLATNGCQKS